MYCLSQVRQCAKCQGAKNKKFPTVAPTGASIPVKRTSQGMKKIKTNCVPMYTEISMKGLGPWVVIGTDLIGPLPETLDGNRYIVTVIDYFTKWTEAMAIRNKDARSVAKCLANSLFRYVLSPFFSFLLHCILDVGCSANLIVAIMLCYEFFTVTTKC